MYFSICIGNLPTASTWWAPSSNLGMIPHTSASFLVDTAHIQSPADKRYYIIINMECWNAVHKKKNINVWPEALYLQQERCCISFLIAIWYQFPQYLKSSWTEKINIHWVYQPQISELRYTNRLNTLPIFVFFMIYSYNLAVVLLTHLRIWLLKV